MAKVTATGKYPKQIDDFVLYELNNQIIMRAKSGFTSKELKTSPKYALSRQNASEFGRVSATCKQLRLALSGYLPKKNNLAVVNALTKKMRQLLVYDAVSARGERTLAKALATTEAQQELKGYHFNPEATVALHYTIANDQLQLTTQEIEVPKGATSVSCTVLALDFDFETTASTLCEGEKHFFSKNTLPKCIELGIPTIKQTKGVLITILLAEFYIQDTGGYVPVADDRSKVVVVV